MSGNLHLTGETESVLPGGEALIRAGGHSFLVANSVPGDLISFKPIQKRRGAARASLIQVLKASPDRIEPDCPVAEQCGGCALQHIKQHKQAEIKSGWVSDAFRKHQSNNTLWIPAEVTSGHGRRRLRWYVGKDSDGSFLGFRAKNAHRVVRHQSCMTATDEANVLRQKLESSADAIALELFESVQLVQLEDGIHLILEGGVAIDGSAIPFHAVDGLAVQWWHRKNGVTLPLSRPVHCFYDALPEGDDKDILIQIGPDDFIQGQKEGNRQMIEQVAEWCEGARFVVDLFSGVGNFSLPVSAALGVKVTGAELNHASVRAANANAKRLRLEASYQQANLFETFDVEPFAGADVLILDPPRRGAKKVCSMMGSLLPAKIIMVNCDVASGSRDGDILQSLGYRLKTLRALDLFPYTGHVEAMSLWVR